MSNYSWRTAHDAQIRRSAEHVHEENLKLQQRNEMLTASIRRLKDRIEELEPYEAINGKFVKARKDAAAILEDAEFLELCRQKAWDESSSPLKPHYDFPGVFAGKIPIAEAYVYPGGWPPDRSAEEAANLEAGLSSCGKRLVTGEEPSTLPAEVPTSGTFLHALAEKARIQR